MHNFPWRAVTRSRLLHTIQSQSQLALSQNLVRYYHLLEISSHHKYLDQMQTFICSRKELGTRIRNKLQSKKLISHVIQVCIHKSHSIMLYMSVFTKNHIPFNNCKLICWLDIACRARKEYILRYKY